MKIIADMSGNKFLIEASADEIANLHGENSAYSLSDSTKPKVGREIPVVYIFNVHKLLIGYQDGIAGAQRKLTECVDMLKKAAIPFMPNREG